MTRHALLAVALGAAVALVPTRSPGCAIVPLQGKWTGTIGETAVIIWDAPNRIEHFTRAALFGGNSSDFGFLVPTPGRPELADAPGPISARLEVITRPRTVVKKRLGEIGCLPQSRFDAVGAALPAPDAQAVTVVEQKRVGDFDAAVLKATDANALRGWLGANGYTARPELQKWLGDYVDDGWYLSAFKVANANPTPRGDNAGGHLKAVRLSFPTVEPVYPYKEPVDAAKPGPTGFTTPRLLRLFVLAPYRVEPLLGLGQSASPLWQVRTVWAGPLDRPAFEATASACGLPPVEVDKLAVQSWVLTELEDHSTPRSGTADLCFRPSPDQSTVERPPNVVYEDIYWPYTAGGVILVFGVPFVLWLGWRLIRRLIRQLPAAPLD